MRTVAFCLQGFSSVPHVYSLVPQPYYRANPCRGCACKPACWAGAGQSLMSRNSTQPDKRYQRMRR